MNNLSLRKLSIIIFALLLMISSIFGYSAIHLSKEVSLIEGSWSSFKSQHNEKARLLNSLYGVLGYGGMIHNFKNYVLRKDFDYFVKLIRSTGAAQGIVDQYIALSSTPAEKLALNDIKTMLDAYQTSLGLIRNEIEKGNSGSKIDVLVKVDDKLALRGLTVLASEIKAEHSYFNDENNKPVLVSELRAELGFGGMIHAFKNYVLRHEEIYKEQTLKSIAHINEVISRYRKLKTTTGEETALDDIVSVIDKYKANVDLVDQAVLKRRSSEAIDALVRVDDTYALRGLQTLDQGIIQQIDNKSEQLTSMLINVSRRERINGMVLFVSTLLIAIFIFFVFSRKIINPVKNISEVMLEMAHGNLDITIEGQHKNKTVEDTELQKMEASLHIFKKHEIARREAEEEIRKLALSDPLTGLANRNQFTKKYHEMMALANREEKSLTLLAIDLDDFKPINDQYGHAAGDLVLKTVAEKLILTFRETDLVARLGGDEFSVILYGAKEIEGVVRTIERLLALIPSPIPFGKDKLSVGASIGIAQHIYGAEDDLDQLLKNADKALYDAKNLGKNRYSVYRSDKKITASS